MDYEKMWKDLKQTLQIESNAFSRMWLNEQTKYLSSAISGVLKEMEGIESKHQPKQYTWEQILNMNPLPDFIRSFKNTPYGYYHMDNKYVQASNDLKTAISHYGMGFSPSIEEMKNMWTIENLNN